MNITHLRPSSIPTFATAALIAGAICSTPGTAAACPQTAPDPLIDLIADLDLAFSPLARVQTIAAGMEQILETAIDQGPALDFIAANEAVWSTWYQSPFALGTRGIGSNLLGMPSAFAFDGDTIIGSHSMSLGYVSDTGFQPTELGGLPAGMITYRWASAAVADLPDVVMLAFTNKLTYLPEFAQLDPAVFTIHAIVPVSLAEPGPLTGPQIAEALTGVFDGSLAQVGALYDWVDAAIPAIAQSVDSSEQEHQSPCIANVLWLTETDVDTVMFEFKQNYASAGPMIADVIKEALEPPAQDGAGEMGSGNSLSGLWKKAKETTSGVGSAIVLGLGNPTSAAHAAAARAAMEDHAEELQADICHAIDTNRNRLKECPDWPYTEEELLNAFDTWALEMYGCTPP